VRVLFGLLCAAAFFAGLVYVTLRDTGLECRVCSTYAGHEKCSTVGAPDRDAAIMQGLATNCASLAAGMTEGMRCTQTPPSSVTCTGE